MRDSGAERALTYTCSVAGQFIAHYAAFALHVTHAEVDDDPHYIEVANLLGQIYTVVKKKRGKRPSDEWFSNAEEALIEALHRMTIQYGLLVAYLTPLSPSEDLIVREMAVYLQLARERRRSTLH